MVATVRAQFGLTNIPPDQWSYDQRIAYNRALATYILNHPGLFTASESNTALQVNNQFTSGLEDTSFLSDLAVFGTAFRDEGEKTLDSIGDIGRGVRDALSVAGKLLPFAVVGVLAFYAIKAAGEFKRTNKAD